MYLYPLDIRKSLINYNIFTEEIKEKRRKLKSSGIVKEFYLTEKNCYKDLNLRLQTDRENLKTDIEKVNNYAEEFLKEIS